VYAYISAGQSNQRSDEKAVESRMPPAHWLRTKPMHSSLADTDPKAEQVYIAILRRLSAWEKAKLIADMAESGRELVLLNLRKRHPDASDEEILRYLAERMLGPELAERVYGPLPEARSANG
jgi:hypothetical protein